MSYEFTAEHEFAKLVAVVKRLRDPNEGCPWDLRQTFDSLVDFTRDEVNEIAAAIQAEDRSQLCEELGDVLFTLLLHCQIAEDEGSFSLIDVIRVIREKLLRRHPHIFLEPKRISYAEEQALHDAIKSSEKDTGGSAKNFLSLQVGLWG